MYKGNKEKFLKLVSPGVTNTLKKNRKRIKFRKFIKLKNKLKLKWLLFKDDFYKYLKT